MADKPTTGTMAGWLTDPAGGLHQAELPVPVPGADQVAVTVRAWAFNNADLDHATDRHLAGYEFSGEITAVGDGVDTALIGLRVMGTTPGAFADVIVAHHRHVIEIPAALTYREAAALPTALLTEHGALLAAGFAPGQSVLITAGTASIALIGIQIAKALGAKVVVATTRSAGHTGILHQVGSDVVVAGAFVDDVLSATLGAGADVVLDHVGRETFTRCIDAAAVGGTVVNVGRLDGPDTSIDLTVLAQRRVTLRSVSFGFADPETIGRLLDSLVGDVMSAVADGRVRPVIDSTYPFEQAVVAIERLRTGTPTGKVLLSR